MERVNEKSLYRVDGRVVIAIAAGCAQGVLALGTAWLLARVTEIVTGEGGQQGFGGFVAAAALFYVIYMGVYYFSRRAYISAMKHIRLQLKNGLIGGFLWMPWGKHAKSEAGDILSKFQYQTDVLEDSYYNPVMGLIKNAVVIAVSFGAMLIVKWYVAVGVAAVFALYMLLTKNINRKLGELQNNMVAANMKESGETVRLIKSYYTVADYGCRDFFIERYSNRAQEFSKAFCKCNMGYNILGIISGNFETIMVLLIIMAAGVLMISGNTMMSTAALLGMTQLASALITPVTSLGATITKIKSTKNVRDALSDFINDGTEGEAVWNESEGGLPELRCLELKNISFAYDDKPVIDGLSVRFEAGKKYAIVGESGHGKTTLLKLILKQLEPSSGQLCWNGKQYDSISYADLYEKIGYVKQNPVIMDGEQLSGGEKKREALKIARSRGCELLILDEATASLHAELARELELELLKSDKTIIHVTHSLTEETRGLYDGVIAI